MGIFLAKLARVEAHYNVSNIGMIPTMGRRGWNARSRLALSLLFGLIGCSHAVPKSAQTPRTSPAATLVVTNNKWTDVVIYVVHGSSRDRLGQVPSVESAIYSIPPALFAPDGQIVFQVQAQGAPEVYRTSPIMILSSHTTIDLTVENFLGYSTFFVSSEDEP